MKIEFSKTEVQDFFKNHLSVLFPKEMLDGKHFETESEYSGGMIVRITEKKDEVE